MPEARPDLKNTIPRPGIVFLRSFSQPGITGSQKSPRKPKAFTISVSKKIFKTAVLRNKAKRKVREAYRLAVKGMSKHDTLHQLPTLRIDAREGVFKMKIDEIQKLIQNQLLH